MFIGNLYSEGDHYKGTIETACWIDGCGAKVCGLKFW